MQSRLRWVFLAYRLPRQPSTPRIAVWRKLRRLGVAQLLDGLVALPLDARTKEQLEWIADEVQEADGEASLWVAEAASRGVEAQLVGELRARAASEYRAVLDELEQAGDDLSARTLERLRREVRRIGRRDYFPPPERELARRALAQRTERV